MGRLEKQIIIGALALVGVLLSVVVFKGLKPRAKVDVRLPLFIPLEDVSWQDPQPPGTEQGPILFPEFDSKPESGPESGKGTPPMVLQPKPQLPRLYTIQPFDTLSEIAQDQLGSQRRLDEILELNPGLAKDHLVPGETLVLPGLESRPESAKAQSGQGQARDAAVGRRTHTVRAGDSLWRLAEKYYGRGTKVGRIVDANPKLLPDKDTVLKIDWVLVIPR